MIYLRLDLILHHTRPDKGQKPGERSMGDIYSLLHHFYLQRSLYCPQFLHDRGAAMIPVQRIALLHFRNKTILPRLGNPGLAVVLIAAEIDILGQMHPLLQ